MSIHDDTVIANVAAERARQNTKWGEQNHPDGTGPDEITLAHIDDRCVYYLDLARARQLARAATQATDDHAYDGTITWADILLEEVFEATAESEELRLVTELVQVSAVAQQWAAAILRRIEKRTETTA